MTLINSYTAIIQSTQKDINYFIACAISWFQQTLTKNPEIGIEEYHFRLALDELITNAFYHGNKNKPKSAIKIIISNIGDCMNVTVIDEGNGFHEIPDPRNKENIFKRHGRGLFILNSFGDVSWDSVMGCVRFDFKNMNYK